MFLVSAVLCSAVPADAQPDPLDLGSPDSLFMALTQPRLGFDDTTLTAELCLSNDAQAIVGLVVGMQWDNVRLHLDSARLSASVDPLAGFFQFLYYKNSLDSSNHYGRSQCVLMSAPEVQLSALGQPRPVAAY